MCEQGHVLHFRGCLKNVVKGESSLKGKNAVCVRVCTGIQKKEVDSFIWTVSSPHEGLAHMAVTCRAKKEDKEERKEKNKSEG